MSGSGVGGTSTSPTAMAVSLGCETFFTGWNVLGIVHRYCEGIDAPGRSRPSGDRSRLRAEYESCFSSTQASITKSRADREPNEVDQEMNILDALDPIRGFLGFSYSFGPLGLCGCAWN